MTDHITSLTAKNEPSLGVHYTNAEMAGVLIRVILDPLTTEKDPKSILNLRILDPACGDGSFLLGVADYLTHTLLTPPDRTARVADSSLSMLKHRVSQCIAGVDVDERAVNLAFARLHAAGYPIHRSQIRCLNSLFQAETYSGVDKNPLTLESAFGEMFSRPRPGFDAVLGNPPYVDAATLMKKAPDIRRLCLQGYQTATGAWDLYCVFIERALQLTRAGGRHGFIVPSALCAAEYARGARSCLVAHGGLTEIIDLRDSDGFDARVYPMGYALTVDTNRSPQPVQISGAGAVRAGSPTSSSDPWPLLDSGPDWALTHAHPDLSTLAEVHGGATVSEAYTMAPLLTEVCHGDTCSIRVINTGTIDPLCVLWGKKKLRYLGRRLQSPVVARPQLDDLPPTRLQQSRQKKVVVAGLSRRLEAVADLEGEYLAAKSTVVVMPVDGVSVAYLAGVINSDAASAWYRWRYGTLALRGGHLRVGPPQLRALPVPDPRMYPEAAAEVERLTLALCALDGEDEVLWQALNSAVNLLYVAQD
ncbi:MAG: Eco57I restriction-modification methylase domain-containing protein [Bradymonadia bacterium]